MTDSLPQITPKTFGKVILKHALVHLDELEYLISCQLVCKKWNKQLSHERTWRFLCAQKFSEQDTDVSLSYRQIYVNYLKSGCFYIPKFYEISHLLLTPPEVLTNPDSQNITVYFVDGSKANFKIAKSMSVSKIVKLISREIELVNPEQYSLQYQMAEGKLVWLSSRQTLSEQGVLNSSPLYLRRLLYYPCLPNIDLQTLYFDFFQATKEITSGTFPIPKPMAIILGAFHTAINYGAYSPNFEITHYRKQDYLPPEWNSLPNITDQTIQKYASLQKMTKIQIMTEYLMRFRSFAHYGSALFPVRLVDLRGYLGISYHHVFLLDTSSKKFIKEWKLVWLYRWTCTSTVMTLDFGDHERGPLDFATEDGPQITEIIHRYINFIKKCRQGIVNQTITIPIIFGFERGHMEMVNVNLNQSVASLKKYIESKFNISDNSKVSSWGLLAKEDGIWFDLGKTIGFYDIYSLIQSGVSYSVKMRPLIVQLSDQSLQMVYADYSLTCQDIVNIIANKFLLPKHGLFLKFDGKWLHPSKTLLGNNVTDGAIIQLRYKFLPMSNAKDSLLVLNLKYAQAKELVHSGGDHIEHLEKKDIINLAAARMIIENVNDPTYALQTFVPDSWRNTYNLKDRIFNIYKTFVGFTSKQALKKYIRAFGGLGGHITRFLCYYNKKEIILCIDEKQVVFKEVKSKKILKSWEIPNLKQYTSCDFGVSLEFNNDIAILHTNQAEHILMAIDAYAHIAYEAQNASGSKDSESSDEEGEGNYDSVVCFRNKTIEGKLIKIITTGLTANTLVQLDLSWSTLPNTSLQLLTTSLAGNSSLKYLKFFGIIFEPQGLQELVNSVAKCLSVQELELSWCSLDTNTVEAVVNLTKKLQNLCCIRLFGNKIDGKEVSELVEVLFRKNSCVLEFEVDLEKCYLSNVWTATSYENLVQKKTMRNN